MRADGQRIRDFILQLQIQAAKCNYGEQLLIHLRDRLIAGINSGGLQQKLLLLKNPTFQDVRVICEQYEDVNNIVLKDPEVLYNFEQSIKINKNVHRFENSPRYPLSPASKRDVLPPKRSTLGQCLSCGKVHNRATCSFRNATCYNCGKIGHIQNVCRNSNSCKLTDSAISNPTVSFDSLCLSVYSSVNEHLTQNFNSLMESPVISSLTLEVLNL